MKLRNANAVSTSVARSKHKEKHARFSGVLLSIFLVLCVILVFWIATAKRNENGLLTVGGYSVVSVSSSSMDPTFCKGDLLLLKSLTETEIATLSAGDVITFRSAEDINRDGMAGELNTHRIVVHDAERGCFVTQGDNAVTNPTEDRCPVFYDDVVAVYTGIRLPTVGAMFVFLRSPTGFFLCILIPLILFFLSAIWETMAVLFFRDTEANGEGEEA